MTFVDIYVDQDKIYLAKRITEPTKEKNSWCSHVRIQLLQSSSDTHSTSSKQKEQKKNSKH